VEKPFHIKWRLTGPLRLHSSPGYLLINVTELLISSNLDIHWVPPMWVREHANSWRVKDNGHILWLERQGLVLNTYTQLWYTVTQKPQRTHVTAEKASGVRWLWICILAPLLAKWAALGKLAFLRLCPYHHFRTLWKWVNNIRYLNHLGRCLTEDVLQKDMDFLILGNEQCTKGIQEKANTANNLLSQPWKWQECHKVSNIWVWWQRMKIVFQVKKSKIL
jgi:hypothetical protein